MLLRKLAADIITYGYHNMSVEHHIHDYDLEDTDNPPLCGTEIEHLVIKSLVDFPEIHKSVIYIYGNVVTIEDYNGKEFIGATHLDLKTFKWVFGEGTLFLLDNTIEHLYDAPMFNLDISKEEIAKKRKKEHKKSDVIVAS